jgi:peptide chain release factor 1
VIVSVLNPDSSTFKNELYEQILEKDFHIEWFNGTVGAGGQFRNKTATSCRLTHVPTGIVRTSQTRSRQNSLKLAKEAILKDLKDAQHSEIRAIKKDAKSAQIGVDRKRMWDFPRGMVDDFITHKSIKMKDALKGHVDELWR